MRQGGYMCGLHDREDEEKAVMDGCGSDEQAGCTQAAVDSIG